MPNLAKNIRSHGSITQTWLNRLGLLLLLLPVLGISHAQTTFDHDATFFPLDFNHSQVSCDTCHVQRVFKGTPTRCDGCHTTAGRIRASSPSPRHIPVIEDCHYCHRGASWNNIFRVDHYAVLGDCQTCHNGIVAIGKDAGHVQSSEACDNCHRTNHWLNVVFDHSDIVGNCSSCHNGVTATGKNATHILSTDTCDDCHRTTTWDVSRVDHVSVIGTCSSCHLSDRPNDQVHNDNLGRECNECHGTTTSWEGATATPAAARKALLLKRLAQ